MSRAVRKLRDVRTWAGSVRTPIDWPAATLLALCRTRPAVGRMAGAAMGRVWVRPSLLRGIPVGIDPRSAAQFTIYQEVFIDGVYDLTRLAFEPDAVLDCGAFEGYFSLLARAHFPSPPIIAFEPDAANFKGLRVNTADPGLRITAQPSAVSTADGEVAFSGGGCGGRLDPGANGTVRVPVRNLLDVLDQMTPQRLLLKLDIEGEESNLLPALLPRLPRQCAMFFEWHHGAESYEQVSKLLVANGFETSLVRRNELDGAIYIDAFAQRR